MDVSCAVDLEIFVDVYAFHHDCSSAYMYADVSLCHSQHGGINLE
jgi:hypothetical protein